MYFVFFYKSENRKVGQVLPGGRRCWYRLVYMKGEGGGERGKEGEHGTNTVCKWKNDTC
jgi:hypothetical protein